MRGVDLGGWENLKEVRGGEYIVFKTLFSIF